MTDLADVPTGFVLESDDVPWTRIGAVDDIACDRGVAVLIDAVPVALFRLSPLEGRAEQWHAVSHVDPVSLVPVMARGLVGSEELDGETIATVASPLHKRRYDLATGNCLDDDTAPLDVFEVLIVDKQVLVR